MDSDVLQLLVVPVCFLLAGVLGLRLGTPAAVAFGLLGVGSCHVLSLGAAAYAVDHTSRPADVAHLVSQSLFGLGFACLLWIASVFPTGGRPGRLVVLVAGVTVLAPWVGGLAGPTPQVLQPDSAETAVRGPLVEVLPESFAVFATAGLLLSVSAPIVFAVRFARAGAEDRRMMMWPVVGTALVLTALVAGVLLGPAAPVAADAVFLLAAPVLPLALATGPVRHRLLLLTDQTSTLSADLATRVRELEESRHRLSSAAEDERRRIERDLHDGAQQELLAMLSHVEIARDAGDEQRRSEALARVAELGRAAYETVRRTAHGVRPAVLDDLGLVAAVRDVASRSAVPTSVRVIGETGQRYAAEFEGAALLVVTEALANVHKHAAATQIVITVTTGLQLEVTVEDDGRGGIDPTGLGIRGLCDRAEAVGGQVEITSRPGRTRLTARLPGGGHG